MKLWYRAKIGHYKTINKIGKTINPIVETVNLSTSTHSTMDHKHITNVMQKGEENDLTDSGNLAELLQHRIEGEDKNLENYL